jgi:hypothetical protein
MRATEAARFGRIEHFLDESPAITHCIALPVSER